MDDGMMLIINDNGEAEIYDDTYDLTIHCTSEKERDEALKRLDSMQWIPCSEQLPLHGSRVLVTATHKKLGHTAVDVLRYHGDEYGWEGSDFCIVNAWMPLPDVRKGGDND